MSSRPVDVLGCLVPMLASVAIMVLAIVGLVVVVRAFA